MLNQLIENTKCETKEFELDAKDDGEIHTILLHPNLKMSLNPEVVVYIMFPFYYDNYLL